MSVSAGSNHWKSSFKYFLSIELTKRSSVFFIILFTGIVVIDSTIIKFSTYGDAELSTLDNLYIFVILYIAFAVTGIILLNSVHEKTNQSRYKEIRSMKILRGAVTAVQLLNMAIILIAILQMTILNKYAVMLLPSATYLSHLSSLFFLGLLIFNFLSWTKSHNNFVTILYTASIIFLILCVIVSLVYLEGHYARQVIPYKKPYPLHFFVVTFITITKFSESLVTLFDILSVLSFITIWIATIFLLKQYRYKIGRMRYYILVSIPLIYYLFPFESYFGNLFSPLILNSPITYSVVYVLIFSATKQVGALLFSLAFISASGLVVNPRARKSLLVSAIGIAFVFGSIEIATLPYMLYPPYGLITQSFLPLGAYLLLIGIYNSAVTVSRDATLRKEFYKAAQSQLSLLKTIGITQMENELLKKYKPILARSNKLKDDSYQPLEQSDVKEIVHDVLQELQAKQELGKNGTK